MAVMDFREGGFGFTRSRQRARRDHDFEQNGWDDAYQDTRTDMRGGQQFAADPAAGGLPSRLGRLTHYLGAVLSVALMVGLMTWGWQLVMRDVSGIPVIKALAGESRTTPEEPGGELTSYTGYAVNDVASGNEAAEIDQVAIAPDATGLDETDVAMGQFGATAQAPATPAETPLSFDGEPVIALSDAEAAAQAQARAAAEMVAAAQTSEAPATEGTVTAVVTDENGEIADPQAINEALAQASASVATSARPAPRPARRTAAAAAPAIVTAAAASEAPAAAPAPAPAPADRPARRAAESAVETPAAPAPAPAPVQTASNSGGGGLQVQIGAFDSDAIAQSEFGRVSGKYGNLFSGKGQVIQKHEVNGRTFWRLRVAGFGSRDEARKFCQQLIAGGTDCIPTGGQ